MAVLEHLGQSYNQLEGQSHSNWVDSCDNGELSRSHEPADPRAQLHSARPKDRQEWRLDPIRARSRAEHVPEHLDRFGGSKDNEQQSDAQGHIIGCS